MRRTVRGFTLSFEGTEGTEGCRSFMGSMLTCAHELQDEKGKAKTAIHECVNGGSVAAVCGLGAEETAYSCSKFSTVRAQVAALL